MLVFEFSLTNSLSFHDAKSIFQIQPDCILIPFSYVQNNFSIPLLLYMIYSPKQQFLPYTLSLKRFLNNQIIQLIFTAGNSTYY